MPYFEGKTGTYLLNINIAIGTGVDEVDEMVFDIYPNPTLGMVNITGQDIEEINVYNTVGQKIKSVNVQNGEGIQIDLSTLPNGVYVLQALGRGQTMTRRIVKTE